MFPHRLVAPHEPVGTAVRAEHASAVNPELR
jgi:hypothetical protein